MKILNLILFYILMISLNGCGTHVENIIYLKKDSEIDSIAVQNILKSYTVKDSTSLANPKWLLSIEEIDHKFSPIGLRFSIDSITRNRMYSSFYSNTSFENFTSKIKIKKSHILIRKYSVKSYILFTGVGRSTSKLYLNTDNTITISKENYGLGFILVIPGFASSEYFEFNY